MQIIQSIQNRIFEIRGKRVILDFDLSILYEVETRVLNQSVKRNIERFPEDFMFQLKDYEYLMIKDMVSAEYQTPSSHSVMMGKLALNRTNKYLPFAFTEQGVAMLSGIVNSPKAINMNIMIMRVFVEVRKIVNNHGNLKEHLMEIKDRLGEHDTQLNHLVDAIENLIDDKAAQKKFEDRNRIGFKP